MKFLNLLCKEINDVTQNTKIKDFMDNENCLVRIHVSSSDKKFALDLSKEIKKILPKANIVGTAVDGVLFEGEIYDDTHLISITSFEKVEIFTKLLSSKGFKAGEMTKAISSEVNLHSPSTVFLFLGEEIKDIYQMCQYLNTNCAESSFIGGVSGYLDKKTGKATTYVFNDKEIIEDGFVLAGISKEYVLSYTNAVVGHEAVSDVHTITETDGVYISKIDNQNTQDWMREKLGLEDLYINGEKSMDNDILLRMPFVLENEDGSSRILTFDENEKKFTPHYTYFNENQKFRVGYLSSIKSIEEWQNICLDLQSTSVEYMFSYSCLYRRIYLENLSKREMELFPKESIAGAFLRGEIGTKNSQTRYYNGTCSFITLADEESYIDTNFNALNRIAELNDNVKLVNALNQAASKKTAINDLILDDINLMRNVENSSEKSMIDFIRESEKDNYSKICVITNRVFDNKRNKVIGTKQKEISDDLLAKSIDFLKKEYKNFKFEVYRYNKESFFIIINEVKNDAKVIEITQSLYNYINTVNSQEKNFKIFNSMTIALKLERIQKLVLSQNSANIEEYKNTFNIFSEKDEVLSLQEEFELASDLKEVVKNESVMPYVQGIYDNVNGGFYAYEVIMRLMATSGEVLFPEHFLETAKKHGVYLDLSYILVDKVLDFAKNREEKILINISVMDIESEKFAKMVFSKLSEMKNPENIVFEVCDLSLCKDMEKLKLFLFKLQKLNMKFAVDNFEITDYDIIRENEIDVRYLKITSSYLSDTSEQSKADNIFAATKKLNAELMVKHVETAAMQKQVLSYSIKYTQGFFFSRPVSIEETHAMLQNKLDDEKDTEINLEDNLTYKADRKSKVFVYSGIAVFMILSIIATIFFTRKNIQLVTDLNDTFLIELATGLTEQVSVQMKDSKEFLILAGEFVSSDGYEKEALIENLETISTQSTFDEIYISFDGEMPINYKNEDLLMDIDSFYGNAVKDDVLISSPMQEVSKSAKSEFFIMSYPILNGSIKVGEIYGVYYTNDFASVLDLTVFGGEAFFHLCEVDGAAVVISGDNNNLFQGGDMYTFIDSLDMTNDNTSNSIKLDMENSVPVLLKYKINGQERTAAMIRVEGTDWCVISIMIDDVMNSIQTEIYDNIFNFVAFVFAIFVLYSVILIELERRNKKELYKALESSNLLANSLQTNMEMDSLTRTFSRSAIEEKISTIINKPQETQQSAVVLLDVDNFKSVNDTYGHKTGDLFLQELTSAVKRSLRGGDIIGRIGGDEFVILLSDIGDLQITKSILSRILENVNKIEIKGVSLDQVSISAGVAIVPKEGIDYDEISTKADKALYLAKLAGKNKFMIYDEI